MNSEECKAFSRLLCYPEAWPGTADLTLLPVPAALAWRDGARPGGGLRRLQNLYVGLFINSLPEVPCPPYGSVYLEGTLMGRSTVEISRLYESYGLQSNDMADHIAVELEFLGYLTDPVNRCNPDDFTALTAHLRSWAPAFFDRVRAHDPGGFYGAVCEAAQFKLTCTETASV